MCHFVKLSTFSITRNTQLKVRTHIYINKIESGRFIFIDTDVGSNFKYLTKRIT